MQCLIQDKPKGSPLGLTRSKETVPKFVQTSVVVKEVYLMARKNRPAEENERRTKIRELLQSSNISNKTLRTSFGDVEVAIPETARVNLSRRC